jgi:hypothetical protein
MDPRSFSEAFLLSMNCPSGIALAFNTLYLFKQIKDIAVVTKDLPTIETK